MNNIQKILKIACENYDEKTLQHALRVAQYTIENPLTKKICNEEFAYCCAIAHDLLEDTKITIQDITDSIDYDKSSIERVLTALTHNKEQDSYVDYIKKIKDISQTAYLIKLADMKDHLMQKDTLTEKLQKKYWEAIPYLL